MTVMEFLETAKGRCILSLDDCLGINRIIFYDKTNFKNEEARTKFFNDNNLSDYELVSATSVIPEEYNNFKTLIKGKSDKFFPKFEMSKDLTNKFMESLDAKSTKEINFAITELITNYINEGVNK